MADELYEVTIERVVTGSYEKTQRACVKVVAADADAARRLALDYARFDQGFRHDGKPIEWETTATDETNDGVGDLEFIEADHCVDPECWDAGVHVDEKTAADLEGR